MTEEEAVQAAIAKQAEKQRKTIWEGAIERYMARHELKAYSLGLTASDEAPGEVMPAPEHMGVRGFHWVQRQGEHATIWAWKPEVTSWAWHADGVDWEHGPGAAYADGWRYLGPVSRAHAFAMEQLECRITAAEAENARLRDQLAALGVFDFASLDGIAAAQRYGVKQGFISADTDRPIGETCIAFWEREKAAAERPDKDLDPTKDFPSDFVHNRARDVIRDVLGGAIKPGGLREIKRAVADREKTDAAAEPSARDKALGRAIRLG